mmetsp:Transcript_5717/g.7578  ORF Transcript_5717/g.7578 Transcript_5717/m.7578 type:complete len:433 (-) Transcript_5717:270-1568(-)
MNRQEKNKSGDVESLMGRLNEREGGINMKDRRSPFEALTRSRYTVSFRNFLGLFVLGIVITWFGSEIIRGNDGDGGDEISKITGMDAVSVDTEVVVPEEKEDETPVIVVAEPKTIDETKNDAPTDLPWPRVAWLLSFPNSGTSYTTEFVRKTTALNTASNYGNENMDENGLSVPMYPELSPNGPFWNDPTNEKFSTPPTKGYVLTKTHCGGYCDTCRPEKYVLTPSLFTKECQRSTRVDEKGEKYKTVRYDTNIVQKIIHLIRNPYDNIVARYHLTYKHFLRDGEKDMAEKYPSSMEGFRSFCLDLGKKQKSTERHSDLLDNEVLDLFEDVPCHADFIRYVQWHNYAVLTSLELAVPTMTLHYERYTTHYNETTDRLLEFLGQERKRPPPNFIQGKEYRDYYTKEEREKVKKAVEKMSSSETWELLKHYFED